MLSWLVGYTLASMVGSVLVVRLFDYMFSWLPSGVLVSTVKAGLFVTTWTAITTGSGMRAFSTRVRGLRRKTRSLSGWLNTRR